MKVRHGSEILSRESSVESVELVYALKLFLRVRLHEVHIVRHRLEEKPCEGFAEHGDVQLRILLGERFYHRHHHRHVPHSGESDD